MRVRRPQPFGSALPYLCGIALLLQACADPIGVKRVTAEEALRQFEANALTAGRPSDATQIVLRRFDLEKTWDGDPARALATLHLRAPEVDVANAVLSALAELSFLHARETGDRSFYLAAAVYAYALVLPEDPEKAPHVLDPRMRMGADLYEVALSEAFRSDDGKTVELRAGTLPLPFGELQVAFDDDELVWVGRRLVNLVPIAEFEISGLNNRYHLPGIGMPFAAKTEPIEGAGDALGRFIGPNIRVSATAVLRLENPRAQLERAELHGRLEVFTADAGESFELDDGREVPLELEPTAALAMTLAESRFWTLELSGLRGLLPDRGNEARLIAREPYRAGRIPVIFVHGTASSVGRWADMVNDLDALPSIRSRFQFWFFSYNSGSPIAYSSMLLRRSLNLAVEELRELGPTPCLDEMIVIGHSQGGLLTKMTAIDSGDRFWTRISSTPFDKATMRASARALIGEALFVEPLPYVRRVIFIATPHRGSYLAGPQIVRRIASRLISIPKEVVTLSADLAGVRAGETNLDLERVPTSIDNMSPSNEFIQTLAQIPIAAPIKAHSIIPVDYDDGDVVEDGNDGVVEYRSAHIDDAVSELVVRSGHSTQANPNTIGEVARILSEHAERLECGAP